MKCWNVQITLYITYVEYFIDIQFRSIYHWLRNGIQQKNGKIQNAYEYKWSQTLKCLNWDIWMSWKSRKMKLFRWISVIHILTYVLNDLHPKVKFVDMCFNPSDNVFFVWYRIVDYITATCQLPTNFPFDRLTENLRKDENKTSSITIKSRLEWEEFQYNNIE